MLSFNELVYNKDKTYLVSSNREEFKEFKELEEFRKHNRTYMLVEKVEKNSNLYKDNIIQDNIIQDNVGNKYVVLYTHFELYVNSLSN